MYTHRPETVMENASGSNIWKRNRNNRLSWTSGHHGRTEVITMEDHKPTIEI